MLSTLEEVRLLHSGTANWLKAPNGEPSILNETQWLQVRSNPFKKWFGDWEHDPRNASKILDSNGEPLVVFHGTPPNHYEFSEFSVYDEGIFFAEYQYVANRYATNYCGDELGPIKAVFVNIRNPKLIKSVRYKFDGYSGADASLKKRAEKFKKDHPELKNTPYRYKELIREQFQSHNFDGIILEDHSWQDQIDECRQFAVFLPHQIKSATNNKGGFLSEPNIYM